MVTLTQPWSAKHKRVTKHGSLPYNLSNSFAQPLSSGEIIELALKRGDKDLVDSYQSHDLCYTPNGGSLDLRREIAKMYGPKITEDNILVFPGAQVALQTAALAIVDESCHSIAFTPGYQSVQEAPLHAGSQVTRIPLTADNNWAIDPMEVVKAIRENTRYLLINEPYNPAGTLMAPEIQQQLKEIATKHDMYILCDEVYRLLEHDPKDRLPAMCDFYEKGLSCVTLSKAWGGCGITIGWLAFQDVTLKQKILDVQYFGTACPSRASELQAIMTIRASDEILHKNVSIIRHNFQLLETFIDKYADLFEWVRPKAGAIAFIKFKGPLSSNELGQKLAERGISIKPAYCFTDEVPNDMKYFRVGYGEKVVPQALEKFIEFVDDHKATWKEQMSQHQSSTDN